MLVVGAILGLTLLLGASESSLDVDPAGYQDVLMQDLYKRLSQIDSSYFLDDGGAVDYPAAVEQDGDLPEAEVRLDSRPSGQADIRDSEYLEHSSNAGSTGYIHISGIGGASFCRIYQQN